MENHFFAITTKMYLIKIAMQLLKVDDKKFSPTRLRYNIAYKHNCFAASLHHRYLTDQDRFTYHFSDNS